MLESDLLVAKLAGEIEFPSYRDFISNIPLLEKHGLISVLNRWDTRVRYTVHCKLFIKSYGYYAQGESVGIWMEELLVWGDGTK